MPVSRILGDNSEQERLFRFIDLSKVGLRPPPDPWKPYLPPERGGSQQGSNLEDEVRERERDAQLNGWAGIDVGRAEGEELWRGTASLKEVREGEPG